MPTQPFEKTLVVKPTPGAAQSAPLSEKKATLSVLVGGEVGATFTLGPNATLVGRSPEAHVTLEDDGISRSHARILRRGDQYLIEDLGSTNGTYVGGQRITGTTALVESARIQLGNTILRFALLDQLERDASKRIYEMSVRDGLTGVFNRRYFDERITSEFAFAARHGTALCVLLVDIDHFKRVNDRWGHQAGDAVLRRVVGELRSGVRTEDVVARYGGEEFAILARGIDVMGARLFAERVRAMVERAEIAWEGERIPVTVSIGLSHNHAGAPAKKAERLVSAADQALYGAKRSGRNRVELAASPGRYSAAGSDTSAPAPASDPVEQASSPRRPRYWEKETAPADEEQQRLVGRRASPSGQSRR